MKKHMAPIVRIIISLALVYGAYTETGIWTAISLFLIFVYIEGMTWMTK